MFTTGTQLSVGTGFTAGLDFELSASTPQAVLAGTLSGVSGSFAAWNEVQAYHFTTGLNFTVADTFTPGTEFSFLPWLPRSNMSGTLSGLSGSFSVSVHQTLSQATLSGILEGVSGAFTANIPPQAVIQGTLSGVSGVFEGHNFSYEAVINGTLEGLSGAFAANYDPNVHRYNIASTGSDQQAAASLAQKLCFDYQQAAPIHAAANAAQLDATPLTQSACIVVNGTAPLVSESCMAVDDATPISVATHSTSDQLTPTPISRCGTVADATPLWSDFTAGFDLLEFITSVSRHPVDDASKATRDNLFSITVIVYQPLPFDPFTAGNDLVVATGFTLGLGFNGGSAPVTTIYKERTEHGGWRHSVCSDRQAATRHFKRQCSTVQDARRPPPGTSVLVDPPRPPPVIDPEHITHTIPTQTAYIMQHTLSVTLLDLTPIPMQSVSLSLDADSYAWQFKGVLLDKAALALVQQVGGEPVQLIITINGYTWKVLVERIEHSRQFADRSITLSGRGLSALLGQPYEQPASATQGSVLTVQQIAELHLPLGWTIDWQTVVWNIPAGAYSFTNQTPIQALGNMAGDIGAMLVPSRNSQLLTMLPRYPVLPWDFFDVPADIVIPESALVALTQRPVVPYQANGVYVHGGEVGGVLGWCRLNSTAGDRLAPTVSNALMTDVIGARAVGERILSGQYTQPGIQSATLPMDGDVLPLIDVGQLAQITLDGSPVRGIVNSVSIEASLASVRQTIQIGEETPNTWAIFKELLPRDPLLVATLAETDGATALMTLLDNGVVRVRGTGTVGNQYYIRSGKIDGDAPLMTQSEIVI